MAKKKYTISDLISDKLELLGDICEQCVDIMEDELVIYSAEPPIIWNSDFETWNDFRLNRTKMFIDSKVTPGSEFQLADIDSPGPGWIIVLRDDCIDLITILSKDNFQIMPFDFVRSIYAAIDTINIRNGCMLQYYNTYYERIYHSTSKKNDNHTKKKNTVLKSFNHLFKGTNLNFIKKNKVATEILKYQKLNARTFPMSLNTIKSILTELHEDKKISLPWVK